jgi:hypothetical protein
VVRPDDWETVVPFSLEPLNSGTVTRLIVPQGDFATEARLALHVEG